MKADIQVSIVIVSYNVSALLEKCLKSINNLPQTETIVIDNDSSDDSVEMLKQQFPWIKLIENKINIGFPAANNQGFKFCIGKYIFMLNPDTEIFPDTITQLKKYLEAHNNVGIIAPKLLNSDGSHQYSAWRFPTLAYVTAESFHQNWLIPSKYYIDKGFSEIFDCDSFSGAALLFRKDLLAEIGNLDETLFWIEDIDFCFRAKKAGWELIYFPQSTVIHHSGQSAKKDYRISLSNQVFNKIKYFNKHKSLFEALLVKAVSFLSVILKVIFFGTLSPLKRVYLLKTKAYIFTLPKVFNPPKTIM